MIVGSAFEAPTLVACLDDIAVVGQPIELPAARRIAANIAKLPEAAADAAPLPPPWINEHPESFIVKDAGSASV